MVNVERRAHEFSKLPTSRWPRFISGSSNKISPSGLEPILKISLVSSVSGISERAFTTGFWLPRSSTSRTMTPWF